MVGGFYTPTGMIEDALAVLVSTADGGRHWRKLPIPHAHRVFDLLVGPDAKAYAVLLPRGPGGTVTSTRDGGRTWRSKTLGEVSLTSIFGRIGGDLYVVGGGAGLYRSRPPDP